MSFHILITANDPAKTVVYDGDVDDFDLHEGNPVVLKIGRSANFTGEGNLAAEAKPAWKPPRLKQWPWPRRRA